MPILGKPGVTTTSSTAPDPKGLWYPGLDGVRAVAVTLVFGVHYLRNGNIGWTGVPVFFVLSGFLITGVLYDNRNEENRFRNFYIRRTLRIFPLFYFVWFCILIGGLFLHEQWQPIHVLWPTYLGNYARFLAGTIAVDHIYTSVPWYPIEIGHFWSLAVEEQFYLLWPLVVFKVSDRRALIRICAAAIVIVLLLRVILLVALPHSFLELDFYYRMTFLQADAFLCGGLLALLMRGTAEPRLLRLGPRLFLGTFAVFLAAVVLNGAGHSLSKVVPSNPWVSAYGFTFVDFVAGSLILCALNRRSLIYRILTLSPLRIIGKYSYGFYVYHVLLLPLRIFHLRPSQSTPLALLFLFGDFLVILGVSAISFHCLEMPFLRLKGRFTVRHKALSPSSG